MPDDVHADTGEWGEDVAEKYLRRKGMKILGRRVRFGPRAELDLVAREDQTLVFVEVKARKSEAFGRPSSAVGADKRRVLSRAAVQYIRAIKFRTTFIRFDVVEVVGSPDGPEPIVRHIANAFTLDRRYSLPF